MVTVMANDISNIDFNIKNQTGANPIIQFSVSVSSSYSNIRSIQLLYWLVNNEQTWVTLSRNTADAPFTANLNLSTYAPSGNYEIRSIRATDNAGALVDFTKEQLIQNNLTTNVNFVNPNSDSVSPYLQNLSIGTIDYRDDGIHISIDLTANDALSGIKSNFVLELLSPSGASIQQWAYFDKNGHVIVDFLLDKYSASGSYSINTIRLTDLAGNYNDSRDYLVKQNVPAIKIVNPYEDNLAPEIKDFSLGVIFDSSTGRPIIEMV